MFSSHAKVINAIFAKGTYQGSSKKESWPNTGSQYTILGLPPLHKEITIYRTAGGTHILLPLS